MDSELTVFDAITITAKNSKNRDRHRYTVEEFFELYPILYVANLLDFYPELERIGERLCNLINYKE